MTTQHTLGIVHSWSEVEMQVRQLIDLDPSMIETIVVFNVLGISTCASCEGHLNRRLSAPWVVIGASEASLMEQDLAVMRAIRQARELGRQGLEEQGGQVMADIEQTWNKVRAAHAHVCQRLYLALTLFYHRPYRSLLLKENDYDAQLTLLPSRWSFTGQGLLEPRGAIQQRHRSQLEREQYLCRYQEEMRDFTLFLKTRISDTL